MQRHFSRKYSFQENYGNSWWLGTKNKSTLRVEGGGGGMSVFGKYTIEPQHISDPLRKEQVRGVSCIVVVQMPSVTYHTP